jgi:hypothetical protein
MERFPTGKVNPLRLEQGDSYAVVKKTIPNIFFTFFRDAVCPDGPAEAGAPCAGYGDRPFPCPGHDLLAAPG